MKKAKFSTSFAKKDSTWEDFMFDGDFSSKVKVEPPDEKKSGGVSTAETNSENVPGAEEPILDEDIVLGEGEEDDET